MRNKSGFSLTETMVTLGIVSVVGLGLYSGFTQLDDASRLNAAKQTAQTSQNLLLSILETDLNLHGSGLREEDNGRACLLEYDPVGNTWANSCDSDDFVSSPSPGLSTCFLPSGATQHKLVITNKITPETVLRVQGTLPPYTAQQIEDLRNTYKTSSQPLDWVLRKSFDVDSCDPSKISDGSDLNAFLSANLDFGSMSLTSLQSQIVEVDAASLEFSYTGGSIAVSFTPNVQRVLQTTGNNTALTEPTLSKDVGVQQLENSNLPSVSFPFSTYLIRPTDDTANLHIPTSKDLFILRDRAAATQLTIPFEVEEKSGDTWQPLSPAVQGNFTINVGQLKSDTPTGASLTVDRRIRLGGSTQYVFGMHPIATAKSSSLAATDELEKPTVSLAFADNRMQRASGATLTGDIILNQPATVAEAITNMRLRVTGDCGPIADGNSFQITVSSTSNSSLDTCESADGTNHNLSFPINNSDGTSLQVNITAASAGTNDSANIVLVESDLDEYRVANNSTIDVSIVEGGLLPAVSFLRSSGEAIEPVQGEERETGFVLTFDPPTAASTTVRLSNLTASSGSAAMVCGPSGDYTLPQSEGWESPACTSNIEVPPDTEEFFAQINLLPPSGDPLPTAPRELSFEVLPYENRYTLGDKVRTDISVVRKPRVQFASASYSIDEDSVDDDWDTLTISGALEVVNPNENELLVFLSIDTTEITAPSAAATIATSETADNGDVLLSDPQSNITIPANTSSADFEFQIDNDRFVDNGKWFRANINNVVGDAFVGMQNTANVEITDQDLCPVGGWDSTNDPLNQFPDLTIGQSPTDHFNTRGSTLINTTSIRGGTVRIDDGFDSDEDRLILMGESASDPDSDSALEYSGITHQGVTYNATYFISQGVMEIEVASSGTTPAPNVVRFIREKVAYRNEGEGSGNRTVTFTLGRDVQAWAGHEDGTTHYYKYVAVDSDITWSAARTAATNDQFFGQTGYLATITSFAENRFLADRFNDNGGPPSGWLGGTDQNVGSTNNEGRWIWDTGPEAGQRFWQGELGGGQHITGSGLLGTANTNNDKECVTQTVAWNGSTHEYDTWGDDGTKDDRWRLDYGYSESIVDGKPVGNRRFANWSCYNDSNGMEPNDSGNNEDYLQMTGSDIGGGMWNDLAGTAGVGDDSPYRVNGYYIEYGGPEKSDFGIRNLKLSQTSSFSATSCGITHTPPDTTCRAWSDLTAQETATPGLADFYSPASLASSGKGVFSRTRTVAHVYINHQNYVQANDQLLLADSTASSGGVGITNYAAVSITTDVTGSDATFSITGKYYANQGYLKVNSNTGATGQQWADILNQVVEYQNNSSPTASDFSTERSITFTLGGGIAWPYHPDGTTHIYRYVEDDDITWSDAQSAAVNNSTNYYSEVGYLATITSEAEQEFLARNFVRPNGAPVIAWLGGTDEDTEGTWIWHDGPESGVQFWSGALTAGRPMLSGDGSVDSDYSMPTCQQQTTARDGSLHNSGTDVHVLDMLQGTTADSSPHRYTKWSCAPNDLQRPEPSGLATGNQEDWLILSATARGGETWNDTLSGGSSGDDWLNTTGYLQEFGGDNEFFNRSTTQTFRISPQQCVMTRETATTGCLPGADLSIGTASSNDFYGPNNDVVSANITEARVQIVGNFVSNGISDRDELALRGTTGSLVNENRTKRYEDVPLINGSSTVDVNGEYDFVTGVMRLTAESAVPASTMVDFINERVQLISSASSTGAKDIGFTLGDAVVWTGHEDGVTRYYRFVEYGDSDSRTWTNARSGAASDAQKYFGVPGYLATITSKAENDFIAGSFANQGSPIAGWLGGSDNRSSGVWEWLSGPEGGNTSNSGTSTSNRMKFWAGNDGTNTKPVDLSGATITTSPPTSSHAMLSGSSNCGAGDPACCRDQYTGYHDQTPADAEDAADLLDQDGDPLKHHFFGYTESLDSSGNVTINTGRRFANWSCNGGTPQPSDSGTQNFLLITGSPLGAGMWNDVQDGGITSDTDIYWQQGYYVEYGGGAVNGGGTWSHNFNDRRIGRVVRVPQDCAMPDGGFSRID